MDECKQVLEAAAEGAGRAFIDPVDFLRPGHVPAGYVQFPTADMADALRLVEACLAFLQRGFRLLARRLVDGQHQCAGLAAQLDHFRREEDEQFFALFVALRDFVIRYATPKLHFGRPGETFFGTDPAADFHRRSAYRLLARPAKQVGKCTIHVENASIREPGDGNGDGAGPEDLMKLFLGVPQFLLRRLPGRDVLGGGDDDFPVEPGASYQPDILGERRAVGAQAPEFEALRLAGESTLQRSSDPGQIVHARRGDEFRRMADEALPGMAVHADGTGVDIQEAAVAILDVYGLVNGIEQVVVAGFAAGKRSDLFAKVVA